LASGLRGVLIVLVLLAVALASGRAAGGTATSSPSDSTPYPSYCAADQPTCLFRIGVAYCRYYNDIDGNLRDDTQVQCWDMGRSQRFKDFTGRWVILHRGWAWMTTQDSNKVVLHAHDTFRLPALARPLQFHPASSFHYGDYDCRRYGDGARCTVPSERYPGSLLAIFLTKRGGVWYKRIPA
jgi:hypothetical protein